MSLQYKTTHIIEALRNLVSQFKGKDIFDKILTIYVTQIQELETVFDSLFIDRCLDNSEGVQLNGLGSIVGEDRQGRNDDDYRVAVRARISLNLSESTPEDIIFLMRSITDGSAIDLREFFPAAITVEIINAIDSIIDPVKTVAFLLSAKAAGVKAQLKYHVAGPFQFDTGLGFDEGKYGGAI